MQTFHFYDKNWEMATNCPVLMLYFGCFRSEIDSLPEDGVDDDVWAASLVAALDVVRGVPWLGADVVLPDRGLVLVQVLRVAEAQVAVLAMDSVAHGQGQAHPEAGHHRQLRGIHHAWGHFTSFTERFLLTHHIAE